MGTYHWPAFDDADREGEAVGGGMPLSEQGVTCKKLVLPATKFSSKIVKISYELLDGAKPSFLSQLGAVLGQRIARAQNRWFTSGPASVVGTAEVGITAAGQTAFTINELLDLPLTVDPAYRESPSAGFMMSDGILSVVKKLKDSNGRPIFQAVAPGVFMIDQWRVFPNNHMIASVTPARTSASATPLTERPILFGDFHAYKVWDGRRIDLRMWMESEGLVENDLRAVDAVQYGDGFLMHPAAVKALQMAPPES